MTRDAGDVLHGELRDELVAALQRVPELAGRELTLTPALRRHHEPQLPVDAGGHRRSLGDPPGRQRHAPAGHQPRGGARGDGRRGRRRASGPRSSRSSGPRAISSPGSSRARRSATRPSTGPTTLAGSPTRSGAFHEGPAIPGLFIPLPDRRGVPGPGAGARRADPARVRAGRGDRRGGSSSPASRTRSSCGRATTTCSTRTSSTTGRGSGSSTGSTRGWATRSSTSATSAINHELTPDEDAVLLAAYDGRGVRAGPARAADAVPGGVRLPRGDVGRAPAGDQHARRRLPRLRRRALRPAARERRDAALRACPATRSPATDPSGRAARLPATADEGLAARTRAIEPTPVARTAVATGRDRRRRRVGRRVARRRSDRPGLAVAPLVGSRGSSWPDRGDLAVGARRVRSPPSSSSRPRPRRARRPRPRRPRPPRPSRRPPAARDAGASPPAAGVRPAIRRPVLIGAGDIARCGTNGDEQTARARRAQRGHRVHPRRQRLRRRLARRVPRLLRPVVGPGQGSDRAARAGQPRLRHGRTPRAIATTSASGRRRDGDTWYSRDLGDWHVIVLDANCSELAGGCGPGRRSCAWLRARPRGQRARCTLAIWHQPRFSSGEHGNDPSVAPFWDALYAAGADLIVNGHDHDYERFAPQDPTGNRDPGSGIVEIVVGTGGGELRDVGPRGRQLDASAAVGSSASSSSRSTPTAGRRSSSRPTGRSTTGARTCH